jgi:hypothetical protein
MRDAKKRIASADRAQRAWDEFFAPMIGELRSAYSERMLEVATTELNPAKRADMITALSNAVKVLDTLKGGMLETIRDGELAQAEQLRVEKIEKMTAPKRRLLNIGAY